MNRKDDLIPDVAVFDIDGTIIRNNTFFSFVRFFLKRNHKLRYFVFLLLSSGPFKVFWVLYNKIFSFELYRHLCVWLLRGAYESEVSKAAFDFIDLLGDEEYFAPTLHLISDFKKKGMDIVLISGTLSYLAESLGERLGATSAIGFLPALVNGRLTGQIESDPRGRKHVFLRSLLVEKQFFFVTDNKEDMPLILLANKAWVVSKKKNVTWWKSHLKGLTIVERES